MGLLMGVPSRFLGQEPDEYAVKAAFLFNFSKFVEWPQSGNSGSFGICILGDTFEESLDNVTRGKSVAGHPIQVRRIKEPVEGKSCQIAFISSAERIKAAKLIELVRGTPVLTVGETKEFMRMGGMVSLSMEDSHVNISINSGATQAGSLKVSAKLLSLAKIYKND
jgi:hypothetical protein